MRRNAHAGKWLSGGFSLNVFTPDELDEIHLATLEVLHKTGLFVEDEEAIEVFHGGGAQVDRKKKVVKLPSYLVEDAIRSAPSKVCLAGRNPKHDFVLESNRVGFTNFGEGVLIYDAYSGKLRGTTKQDVADSAKVVDYLSDIDVYERAVGAHDVPMATVQLHNAEAWLSNTSKHGFMGSGDGYLSEKLVDMTAAIVGGRDKLREHPIISFVTCPVSPLKLVKDTCEIIMAGARNGIVVNVLSMAMAGGSSPATLAGTLVDHNCEVLGGIVIGQLACKGTPMVYGSSTTAMDLRLAAASVGSPECAMISAAVAKLARFYSLPSWVAGG